MCVKTQQRAQQPLSARDAVEPTASFSIDKLKVYEAMAGSLNVEEIALITIWGRENVQNGSIGLIVILIFTIYFVRHKVLLISMTRFAFFRFHRLTCRRLLLQFVESLQ